MPLTPMEGGTDSARIWPEAVEYSALFTAADSLSRTPAGAGNRRTWTFHTCYKPSFSIDASADRCLLSAGSAGATATTVQLGQWPNGMHKFMLFNRIAGTITLQYTGAFLEDHTEHYDIAVAIDTTQVTESERVKAWINGRAMALTTVVACVQNQETQVNNGVLHRFAEQAYYLGAKGEGYYAHAHLVDGQALTPDAFGEWSGKVTGLWVPKKYAGTYGTNGFHLDFSNAAAMGADASGQANDWTVNGSPVQTLDTPTNNHCTLNPLDPATTGTLSGGNLTVAGGVATVTMRPETGKWSYKKDGAEQLYDAAVSGQFNPVLAAGTYDFGASGYTPTAGYATLCAANLPEPIVLRSSTVADIVLREGTGAEASVTSLEFAPDWLLVKDRDAALNWILGDTKRGATHYLSINTTTVDNTAAQTFKALNADGYTLGTDVWLNTAGDSFLDLCLKAGADQGFAIVTYTGTGAARTVPHTLGKAPTFMVVKALNSPQNWLVYHVALGAAKRLALNLADAAATSSAPWNNTEPTSTEFTVGASGGTNASGIQYIAYLCTDSDIFKAFSYTGNGSTDGPFVHLGGKPLCLPFVRSTADGLYWNFCSGAQTPMNPIDRFLYPDLANAEATRDCWRFAASGFKVVDDNVHRNGGGVLHVGLAILESPNKYTNAF
ncbi:MAG: hypothetical protein V3571_08105 [Pseudodesulfovibrio sp.]